MNKSLLIFLTGIITACSNDVPVPPAEPSLATPLKAVTTNVSLALNWFAEAEHAGYFTAATEGFYADAGLSVKIIPGGPDVPVLQRVAVGDVEFGITNADDLLIARSQGVPVVALMAPIQHTALCFLVHKDSGITDLNSLHDVTLAMTPTNPHAVYLRKKLELSNVVIVPYSGNVAPFLLNKNYVSQGYVFSEPFVVKDKGGDADCLMLSVTGFDPYASLLITNAKMIAEKPEIVRAMTRASVEGWKKYVVAPVSTHALIKTLNPQMNDAILQYGFDVLKPMVLDGVGEDGIGAMDSKRWQTLANQLEEIGLIKPGAITVNSAYTGEFMP